MATIGINALFLIPNQVGGTEYHLRMFIEALQAHDSHNQYVLFCNRENFETFSLSNPKWSKVLCPVNAHSRVQRIVFEQLQFPKLVNQYHCDILHSYGYFGPIFLNKCKHVVTIHDTNWRDHPEDVSFISGIILRLLVEQCLLRASAIVTDSEFSKSRLQHYFPKQKRKIVVIWLWVSREFSAVQHAPTKKDQYILCVSGMYPHKKILYLIKLWREFSMTNENVKLILVGKNGQDESDVINSINGINSISYFPKVGFAQLLELYKKASLFIFPSVYEGFGYPVYEAYTVGVPTLVGKKNLYSSQLQNTVFELTFDLEKDVQIISKMLGQKADKHPPLKFNAKESCEQLLQLYETLV